MASTLSLSSSLRYFLPPTRTSHAPVIPLFASPRLRPRSIKPLRANLKTPISALGSSSPSASSTAGMAGQNKKKAEVFDSEEQLAVQLAKYTADLSDKFSKERGAFTVVLSGGSLIKALRKLCEAPYLDSVEWGKWHVLWVDERVVPKDHEDSNYKLALDGFLSKSRESNAVFRVKNSLLYLIGIVGCLGDVIVPIPAGNVYAINDALSAEGAADDYETCLKHLVTNGVLATSKATGFPKFDLMLLGMGPDGHVASLFPGHPLVNEKEKWVTFIKDSPKPPPERITFTFPVINSSAYIAMVVNGAGKSGAVQTALGNSENSATLPVQLVAPEDELTWFLDKEAASKL
uniref:6-phosphogluconolactonase n=1 Tax=Rosa rugosa TaxID=74645 RepID=J7FY92_ROSRU|nr:6-phosphogluconolactonase [Rosa rugosa]